MKRGAFILTGFVVLATGGCAADGSDGAPSEPVAATTIAVTPELVRQGRTAYRKYCTQCHGYSGKGDGTSAAHLDPPPRDHTDAVLMDEIGDQTIVDTLRLGPEERGFANMPAFPQVSVDEVIALVAYVRSLSDPDVTEIAVEGIR